MLVVNLVLLQLWPKAKILIYIKLREVRTNIGFNYIKYIKPNGYKH